MSLNPIDWGWQIQDNHLIPIATDIDTDPRDLIKVVRCNFRIDTKSPCSSLLCSCRKVGLPCVILCSKCGGAECDNPSPSFTVEGCGSDTASDDNEAIAEESNQGGLDSQFYLKYLFECVNEETISASEIVNNFCWMGFC